jgi:hypothetical protein
VVIWSSVVLNCYYILCVFNSWRICETDLRDHIEGRKWEGQYVSAYRQKMVDKFMIKSAKQEVKPAYS